MARPVPRPIAGLGRARSSHVPRRGHGAQENKHNGRETRKPDERFVILPGHPFYGRRVQVLGRRSSRTYTRCIIEDPAHPGFHYHILERWLSTSPPLARPVPIAAHCPIWLSLPALDRMVQMILTKDQARGEREHDPLIERDDGTGVDTAATEEQGTARRDALLPGPEAGRRDPS
jgi:hypothetical protein